MSKKIVMVRMVEGGFTEIRVTAVVSHANKAFFNQNKGHLGL